MKKGLKYFVLLTFALAGLVLTDKVGAAEKVVLESNIAVEGKLSSETKKITYEMQVDKTGYQNLVFDVEDGGSVEGGWEVSIFDENNKEIYKKYFLKEDTKIGKYTFAKGSKLRAEISLANEFSVPETSYKVTFETVEADDYEAEDNNVFSKATKLKNKKEVTANSLDGKDVDYFVYTLPENGVTKIEFEIPDFDAETVKNGWDVELLDKSKKVIDKHSNITSDVSFENITFKKGTKLYVKVKPTYDHSWFVPYFVDYEIKAETKKSSAWEKEENGSFSKATSLGKAKKGVLWDSSDVDYYVLKANKTKTYTFSFEAEDNDTFDYEISVFVGSKKKAIASKSARNEESIKFKVKKGQKIWIKVGKQFSFNHTQNVYELKIK